jgi:predicted anti-sigma-YlaC factor YlaD
MRLRISVQLDGELPQADQAELARHLGRCAACAQFARALASLTEVLRADPRTMPDPDVQAHVAKAGSLLLVGALTLILGAGKSTGANHHARCRSLWGIATICKAGA